MSTKLLACSRDSAKLTCGGGVGGALSRQGQYGLLRMYHACKRACMRAAERQQAHKHTPTAPPPPHTLVAPMLRKRLNSILKNEASPPWLVTLPLSPCGWRVNGSAAGAAKVQEGRPSPCLERPSMPSCMEGQQSIRAQQRSGTRTAPAPA